MSKAGPAISATTSVEAATTSVEGVPLLTDSHRERGGFRIVEDLVELRRASEL
jgi:hypothetical protein